MSRDRKIFYYNLGYIRLVDDKIIYFIFHNEYSQSYVNHVKFIKFELILITIVEHNFFF